MSKIIKILLIMVLPMILESVLSCCDCLEPSYLNYTNCSLTAQNFDNRGDTPEIIQSGAISKKAYGIRLTITRSENTCSTERQNSPFIQSAFATSCGCPPEYIYMPLDSIVNISVTSYNDFDASHAAGADVSEYFYVFRWNEFYTINEFTENLRGEEDYYLDPLKEIDLLMMSPPLYGTEHQFGISIELSDGRMLPAQTGKVQLI